MQNCYLMIEGVKGTSTIKKDAIEIDSFSWGVANAAAAAKGSGESRAGRPSFGELHISKLVDPTSHELFKHCCVCEAFPSATLGFMKQIGTANEEYFHLILTQVYISSISVQPGGDNPTESVSMSYEQLEFGYNPEKPDKKGLQGFKMCKYNVVENKPA